MPNVIDSISTANTRNSKYDWNTWVDGQAREFVHGEDFTCDPKSFRQNAYVAANTYGLKLNSRLIAAEKDADDNVISEARVELQFVPKPAEDPQDAVEDASDEDLAAAQVALDAEDAAVSA